MKKIIIPSTALPVSHFERQLTYLSTTLNYLPTTLTYLSTTLTSKMTYLPTTLTYLPTKDELRRVRIEHARNPPGSVHGAALISARETFHDCCIIYVIPDLYPLPVLLYLNSNLDQTEGVE